MYLNHRFCLFTVNDLHGYWMIFFVLPIVLFHAKFNFKIAHSNQLFRFIFTSRDRGPGGSIRKINRIHHKCEPYMDVVFLKKPLNSHEAKFTGMRWELDMFKLSIIRSKLRCAFFPEFIFEFNRNIFMNPYKNLFIRQSIN